jgi:hypothetical protein
VENEIITHGGKRPAEVTIICALFIGLYGWRLYGWFQGFGFIEHSQMFIENPENFHQFFLTVLFIFALEFILIIGIFFGLNGARVLWLWVESANMIGTMVLPHPSTDYGWAGWLLDCERLIWIVSYFVLRNDNVKKYFLAPESGPYPYVHLFNESEIEMSAILENHGYKLIPKRQGCEISQPNGGSARVLTFEDLREYVNKLPLVVYKSHDFDAWTAEKQDGFQEDESTAEKKDEFHEDEWTAEKQAEFQRKMDELNKFFEKQARK